MNLFQAEEDDLVRVVKGLLEKEDMQAKKQFYEQKMPTSREKTKGGFKKTKSVIGCPLDRLWEDFPKIKILNFLFVEYLPNINN